MLHKTKGIVLGHINYKDTSIIAKIYTEEFGLRSYIVNGAKTSKKGGKMAYFQSLSLLDLVVYENEKRDIQRISEIKLLFPFISIPFNHTKSIIAMFISELLMKSLKEESSNLPKFQFLVDDILKLDSINENIENFHLEFMIKLSVFLGFSPSKPEDFKHAGVSLNYHKESLIERVLIKNKSLLNGNERSEFLEILINYYQYHLDNFGPFNSINVLKDVVHH
jgi:DNA repair protein RecO (recombination protein O)